MNQQPKALVGGVQNTEDGFEANTDTQANLVKLIEALQEIDTTTPLAKTNEKSIDDNNGNRISF